MLKFLKYVVIMVALSSSLHADTHHYGNSAFEEVTPDFYRAQIPDRDLWLVMERITDENIKGWRTYANVQANSRMISHTSRYLNYKNGGSTQDGVCHFKEVLHDVDHEVNEVWVAYITAVDKPVYVKDKFKGYCCASAVLADDIEKIFSEEETAQIANYINQIKMFVTIFSSPAAKITSHMGITFPCESTYFPKEKGISMFLHSFAAKVMKIRNPERRLMVNAPVGVMEVILAKTLQPEHVYIGTLENIKCKERQETESFEEFLNRKRSFSQCYTEQEARKTFEENKFKHYFHALQRTLSKQGDIFAYAKLDEQVKLELKQQVEDLIAVRPPLISFKKHDDGLLKLRIFDPANRDAVWLEILENDQNYNFAYSSAFRPQGSTHFVAIDLEALADCKACI